MVIKNNLISSKISQGHIEIIFSFLLFIIVIMFVFIFLNPLAQSKEKDYNIYNIQDTIMRNVSSEIGKMSIIVKNIGDCYDPVEVMSYGSRLIVVHEYDRKYVAYFGDIFPNVPPTCSSPYNYSLGIYTVEDIIVYSKIKALAELYKSDYESVKRNIGSRGDFAFSFRDVNNNIIGELSALDRAPAGVEVDAEEFPVRVINSNGEIEELIFNVRSW